MDRRRGFKAAAKSEETLLPSSDKEVELDMEIGNMVSVQASLD